MSRPIDGDAMMKRLEEWNTNDSMDKALYNFALMRIIEQPTIEPERKWETCFDCPLAHGCPKIRGCTNDQAGKYASEIPDDCPLSIEPERKKGKWILVTDNNGQHFICDHCGEWKYRQNQKFCGECGAKMEGAEPEDIPMEYFESGGR